MHHDAPVAPLRGAGPRLAAALTIFVGAAMPAAAADAAANWPERPIRVLVGFPPGSGTDMLARHVGTGLGTRLGQQLVVDNRPGANGIIAANIARTAAPDGYTLLFMSVSHTMNAAVRELPFDAVKSFTPIARLASGPLVVVAPAAFPASSIADMVALARTKADGVSYAVSGTAGINHFAAALFESQAGVRLHGVQYKGGPQALTDVIAGRVDLMFGTMTIALRHLRDGRLKALAVTSARRSPLLPEVPTVTESGVAGYEISTWWGVIAPAGVPAAIADRLAAEMRAVMGQPESTRRLAASGAESAVVGGDAFGRVLSGEVEKWTAVARRAGIQAR